jgi:hypothetical protein
VFPQIDSVSATVRITQVLIQDSRSGDRGGAIMFRSGAITPSVDLSWSTVQNATSMRGGSLFAEGAVLVVDAAEFLNTTGTTARVLRDDAQCGLDGGCWMLMRPSFSLFFLIRLFQLRVTAASWAAWP